jgi:hypothetical protein
MRVRGEPNFTWSVLFSIALVSLAPAFWADIFSEVSEQQPWLVQLGRALRPIDQYANARRSERCLSSSHSHRADCYLDGIYQGSPMDMGCAINICPRMGLGISPTLSALWRVRFHLRLHERLDDAVYRSGSARSWALLVLIFSLLIIAVLLPIRSFFLARDISKPVPTLSLRRLAFCVAGAFVLLVAMFTWVRIGVLGEIFPTELNSTQRLPSPPPPPGQEG